MNKESFRRLLRPLVKQKTPFLAYCWERGYGVIRLDEVQVPVFPPCEEYYHGVTTSETKPHTLTKRGRARWEKNLAQLLRTGNQVITVEFDGEQAIIEGGDFDL